MLEYKTNSDDAGRRLDMLVSSLYPQFTRSALELLFDKKMVNVNGREAKASYRIKSDDKIQVDETELRHEPPSIKMPILYEDEDVAVIDKLAGFLTHSKGALNHEATVASFIKPKIKNMSGNRAGIVHRLDRGTSGVIITAKNSDALSWLQKQFSQRKVTKIYQAIVEGTIDPKEAVIDAPIARNPRRPQTFKVLSIGRPAMTRYKVIKEFKKNDNNYSVLEIQPKTGRTHQIRVHLAYIGHPVVGDSVYGHGGQPILLHAKELELTLPNRRREIFKAPTPKSFREFTDD